MYEDILNESIETMDKSRKNLLSAMYQKAKEITDFGKMTILFNESIYDSEEVGIVNFMEMADYGVVMFIINEVGQEKGVESLKTDTLVKLAEQLKNGEYQIIDTSGIQ